jgi:hypothetical protein
MANQQRESVLCLVRFCFVSLSDCFLDKEPPKVKCLDATLNICDARLPVDFNPRRRAAGRPTRCLPDLFQMDKRGPSS